MQVLMQQFATITSTGTVTLTGVAGTTIVTATQAATTKFAGATATADLVATDGYNVGDTGPGGGIVFYDAVTAQSWGRYLEVAPTDYQVKNVRTAVGWGCSGVSTGAAATAIGAGKANTATILTKCSAAGTAADVANKYFTTTTPNAPGAAGQWFLPSKDELNELCKIYSNGRTGHRLNYRDVSEWLHRKYITNWRFCYVLLAILVLLSTARARLLIRISRAGYSSTPARILAATCVQ